MKFQWERLEDNMFGPAFDLEEQVIRWFILRDHDSALYIWRDP